MKSILFVFLLININIANAVELNTPRVLLIGVDAVPYSIIEKLTGNNSKLKLFENLKGPTGVINSFPSNSHVAWSGLLEPFNVAKPPGYEGRYFDLGKQEVTGGISLFDEPTDWQRYFSWRLDGVITTAFAYGWPEHYSLTEVDDGLEAFYKSQQDYFSMYVVSTDGIGHTKGPTVLIDFLIALDQKLKNFKLLHPDMPFYTVLISDHGMAGGAALENILPMVSQSLENSGFIIRDDIKADEDVSLISFGLLTSFVIYSKDKPKQEIAKLVSNVIGVDLCATTDQGSWRVMNRNGYAVIHHKREQQKSFWRYEIKTADPLHYESVLQKLLLSSTDNNNQQGWFSDQQWFGASKNEYYPDALYRIANGSNLVTNPASVVCSVATGFMFGSLFTEYVAIPTVGPLKWTHGALLRDASLGFLMSDLPGWVAPDMIRYNKALKFLANKVQMMH
ncbi:MAG: hypothetical protein ACC653_02445 [Gammaproteobacteria bacterium]